VCVVKEHERGSNTEKTRQRQRQRQRQIQIQRQRQRDRDGDRERQRERETETERDRERDRERETERQRGRERQRGVFVRAKTCKIHTLAMAASQHKQLSNTQTAPAVHAARDQGAAFLGLGATAHQNADNGKRQSQRITVSEQEGERATS
jgi:hypothetical protein